MTEPIIVAEWPANFHETLRVRLDEYQGHKVLDLRKWYSNGDGELRPGRSGLTIGVRHLGPLADALVKAVEMARAGGIITDDDTKVA